jgi:hypothetical protein
MPVYVNEWQNKVKQDSCTDFHLFTYISASCLLTVLSVQLYCFTLFCHSFTYSGILSLNCFVSATVLFYFILHIPTSCLLTVLSVQLSCFTLFCHSFTYTDILSLYHFISTTVLPYFILPFIYIYRHPFSELFS